MKGILAVDFSPNGYQLASGSEDHSVRIWDLRTKRSLYTIPAHQSLVSQVRTAARQGSRRLTTLGCGDDSVNKQATAMQQLCSPAHVEPVYGAACCVGRRLHGRWQQP